MPNLANMTANQNVYVHLKVEYASITIDWKSIKYTIACQIRSLSKRPIRMTFLFDFASFGYVDFFLQSIYIQSIF